MAEQKQEKKQSAYGNLINDYQTLAAYASAINRVKKNEYVEELPQLAAAAVPENLQPERETVLRLDPKNDVTALLQWINAGYVESNLKIKKNVKDNLEAIINDTDVKEEILMKNIPYINPNTNSENKAYKEITELQNKLKYMGMICGKIYNKKELNNDEKNAIMNECIEFYKKECPGEEKIHTLNALTHLASYSEVLRNARFMELTKESSEKSTEKLKAYGVRKYVIDSIKGNEDKNDMFFASIAEEKLKKQNPKENYSREEQYSDDSLSDLEDN